MSIELILGIIGLLSTTLFIGACGWLAFTQKPISNDKRIGADCDTDSPRDTNAKKNHGKIAAIVEEQRHRQPERD